MFLVKLETLFLGRVLHDRKQSKKIHLHCPKIHSQALFSNCEILYCFHSVLSIYPCTSLILSSLFCLPFQLFAQRWRICNLLPAQYGSPHHSPSCGSAAAGHYPGLLWPSVEISALLGPASVRQHGKYDFMTENGYILKQAPCTAPCFSPRTPVNTIRKLEF